MSLQDYDAISGFSLPELYGRRSKVQGPQSGDTLAPNRDLSDRDLDSDEDGMPRDPVTRKIALMDITEKEKPYGDRPSITVTSRFNQAKDIDQKYTEYALLLRRKIDKTGNGLGTDLEIWSPVIREVLRELLADCTYLNLVACPINIPQPYHALFHYRKEIRQHASSTHLEENVKCHLDVLIKFMDTNLLKTEREYNRYILHGLTTFPLLWTIFRPEAIVVLDSEHFRECYRVNNCREVVLESGNSVFEITTWYWDYNGSAFGPAKSKLVIKEFQGTKSLTDLNVYPISCLDEDDRLTLEEQLVARGKKWRSLVDRSHRQYSGPSWTGDVSDPQSMADLITRHVGGRVILDYQSHQEYNYGLATVLYSQSGAVKKKRERRDDDSLDLPLPRYPYRRSSEESSTHITEEEKRALKNMKCHPNNDEYQMSNDEALLCPARIRGFALSEKRWAFFLVDNIEDIRWSESAFDVLEADDATKLQLLAVVETHYTERSVSGIIANKGAGLSILLHGPPGTGKTLTAEVMAEHTHRPLYYIGAGELGDYVRDMEPRLKKIFNLAKSWQAILLLDEADVFLAKRRSNDVYRNGFVSVFLRLLEHYEGILFLTTNRLEEFDPAFQSRLRLRLAYNELDPTKRSRIWRNMLRQLKDCQSWDSEVFEKLGRDFELNGREIDNLLRTAVAVAAYKSTPLTISILKSVYDQNFS